MPRAKLGEDEAESVRVVEFGALKELSGAAKLDREDEDVPAGKFVGQGVAKAAEGEDKT